MLFPAVERLAREAGLAEMMSANVDQHHLFEPKMGVMATWVQDIMDGKETYDSALLKSMIDSFAPVLTEHLHDEIDSLIRLEKCDGVKVKQAMKETAEAAAKTVDPVSDTEDNLRVCLH